MKLSRLFIVLLLLTTVIGCDAKKEKQLILPQTKPAKKLIKKAEKSWDSLHKNNVDVFFTEYEKTNKETKVIIKTDYGNIKLRLYLSLIHI